MGRRRHLTATLLAALTAVTLVCASCYKITFIRQAHRVVKGEAFEGRLSIHDTGNTNGGTYHVYGLFGIRVPKGWSVDGQVVMTQVAKPTTDTGDPNYNTTIERRLIPSQAYARLLNTDYPREGYTWLGFVTQTDFKTLLSGEDPDKRVDSIYVSYRIQTSAEHTGTYYLDYVCGQIDHAKLGQLATADRDWTTRAATFQADNISNVYHTDTSIRLTNADGSIDEPGDALWATPDDWQLQPMTSATTDGTARAYRDLKYNALFTRTRGWNGGDGVLTVGLPNGDVLWTFNDSFYGTVGANRARGNCNFPRNSIMVQKAHDGVLGETEQDLVWLADYVNWRQPSRERYFHARTHLRHPEGEKTEAEIKAGDIDQTKVYWSGDGTVYDGKLQMIWIGVEAAELRNLDIALATYSLEGNEPQNYYLPRLADYLPQSGDYLYRESHTPAVWQGSCSYGSTLCEDPDGHTYLYATEGTRPVVARTQTHSLYSPWQFYVKDAQGRWTWQDSYPTDDERQRSGIMASDDYAVMQPWVFRRGEWYFMVAQAPIFSPLVYIYRARTPYGPFDERRLLVRLPDHLDKLGPQQYHWLYMVNLHPALARQGELVLSTNSDPDDFWSNFNDPGSADYYRPYFYRVFDWQRLYPDLPADPVETPAAARSTTADRTSTYNLLGQPVRHPRHGLYIRGGHKVLIK